MYPAYRDGKRSYEYTVWEKMLCRCQPDGWQQRNKPAYVGCEVHPDFIKFQDFAVWANKQIGFGMTGFDFDKDILQPGNKVYGPDTCCFVPSVINKLMIKNYGIRGKYPIGVSFDKSRGKFHAEVSIDGKNKKLGRFDTPEQASEAYRIAKQDLIQYHVNHWKSSLDPRVVAALIDYVP